MERVRRIELRSSDWRSDAQPIGDTRKTLERAEIIEISSLGWRPRAHPIYHARKYIFSCQRPVSTRQPLPLVAALYGTPILSRDQRKRLPRPFSEHTYTL